MSVIRGSGAVLCNDVCQELDVDGDGDVDRLDVAVFVGGMDGPHE